MRKLDYNALRDRADAYRWSVWHRAQRMCNEAGLDCAGTLHNAIVSLKQGQPWREVDYAKAKRAHHLFQSQFKAHDVLHRLYAANPRRFTFG